MFEMWSAWVLAAFAAAVATALLAAGLLDDLLQIARGTTSMLTGGTTAAKRRGPDAPLRQPRV